MKDLYWMQRFKQLKEESGDLEDAYDGKVVQGTCQRLEKSYFRLTSAPDPAVVRPESVLKLALAQLVASLREGSTTYFYALDQFKGMRQDLTVQHIRNETAAQASLSFLSLCPSSCPKHHEACSNIMP